VIQARGEANLFAPEGGAVPPSTRVTASLTPSAGGAIPIAEPYFTTTIYLDNFGMGAYARMVPTTRILPTRGSLRGTIELSRARAGFSCKCTLAAEGVEFAPNPRLVVVKGQFDELQRDLVAFRESGPVDICEAGAEATRPPQGRPDTSRTASAVLATFNAQATQSAPPNIRAVAAVDRQNIAGVAADAVLADVGSKLSGNVARMLGPDAGHVLKQLQADDPEGNPLRSLGRGIKRMFGGR
jgi:hypothetical protein